MRRVLVVVTLAACASAAPRPLALAEPHATHATHAADTIAIDRDRRARVPAIAEIEMDGRYEPTSFVATVRGHGRPVILIPGLGCPGEVWDDTVAHLGPDVETHVLTLSGFAGRPPIDHPLTATVRLELARYIRERNLDHPVIIGHSMGGFLALWLAASEPDLVGPTIVVDAAPALGGDTDPAFAKQLADDWRTASAAEFVQDTRDFFGGMANNTTKLAPVMTAVARSDKRAFADAFYELFTTDLRPQMSKIRAPVLVLLADTAPADEIRSQTAPIASHEVVVVTGTRHFIFFDDPKTFFRLVDKFLSDHPAPGAQPKT